MSAAKSMAVKRNWARPEFRAACMAGLQRYRARYRGQPMDAAQREAISRGRLEALARRYPDLSEADLIDARALSRKAKIRVGVACELVMADKRKGQSA